ncbi:MAG: hypothetical protein DI625_14650 [Sphingomonas sp.]|nr:MAG: hypothetical protein DI625_14650 [Sphingomonas sp.]
MIAGMSAAPRPVAKAQVSDAIASGLHRAIKAAGGKGACADRMEVDPKTLNRQLSGESTLDATNMLAMLSVDRTSMNDALALYGLIATPKTAQAANDMELLASLTGAGAEMVRRLLDGLLCHKDKAALAELFRPLIPAMQAIVDEHDKRVAA